MKKRKYIFNKLHLLSLIFLLFVSVSYSLFCFLHNVYSVYAAGIQIPQNLKVTSDDRNVILSWTSQKPVWPPYSSDATATSGYVVSYGLYDSATNTIINPAHKISSASIIQLQPLSAGVTYAAQVQALDSNGHASSPSQLITFQSDPSRVNALRQQMNGFFDDFDNPAGPFNELNWNNAYSGCVMPSQGGQFINAQFHSHNQIADGSCDRGVNVSRPRQVFDFTNRTGTITFDFDGTYNRNTWYLDLNNANYGPLDIGGHISLDVIKGQTGASASYPGNTLRFEQSGNSANIYLFDSQGNELATQTTPGVNVCTDFRFCTDPILGGTLSVVNNVRRHWVIKVSQDRAQIFIDNVLVADASGLNLSYQKAYIQWAEFSYNTRKSNQTSILFHWDNFGFDAPSGFTQVVTHNYTDGVIGTASFPLASSSNPVTKTINIPDSIANTTSERLMFTLQMPGFTNYTWSPNDYILFNGKQYSMPDPSTLPGAESMTIGRGGLISTYNPMAIIIPVNNVIQGTNTIEFHLSYAGILNTHVELDFPQNNTPAYTQPVYNPFPPVNDIGHGAVIECVATSCINTPGGGPSHSSIGTFSGTVPVSFLIDDSLPMLGAGVNVGIIQWDLVVDRQTFFSQKTNANYPAATVQNAYQLDTTKLCNGTHEIFIRAFNTNGTVSTPNYFQGDAAQGSYQPVIITTSNQSSNTCDSNLNPSPLPPFLEPQNLFVAPSGNVSVNSTSPTSSPATPSQNSTATNTSTADVTQATPCASLPTTNFGTDTLLAQVTSTGTYTIWTRVMIPDTTNNAYILQIDNQCPLLIGASANIAPNTWTWVNYQNGNPSALVSTALTQGNHILTLIGNKQGVKIDRLIITADPNCIPTGTGDNCATPTVTITSTPIGTTNSLAMKAGMNVEPGMRPWRFHGANPDGWWCGIDANNPCKQGITNGTQMIDKEMGLLGSHGLGVHIVRVEFPWPLIEPQKGVFDFSRSDYIYNSAKQNGLNLEPILLYSPAWEVGGDSTNQGVEYENHAPNAQDFATFVTKVVQRYPDIQYWELWNEANLTNYWVSGVGSYVSSVLTPGYTAIHQNTTNPNTKVVLGGTAGADTNWMNNVYAANGGNFFDIINYHDYVPSAQILSDASLVENVLTAHNQTNKPVWVSEYGGSGLDAGSQITRLTNVLKNISPLAMAIWYNLRDDTPMTCCPPTLISSQVGTNLYGLLDVNYNPKTLNGQSSYDAMRTLLQSSQSPSNTPTITVIPSQIFNPTLTPTPSIGGIENSLSPIPTLTQENNPLPTAPAGKQSIVSFTLINTDTNLPISGYDPLQNGVTLDLSTLPTRHLNIRANTSPSAIGSVKFGYDSNNNYRVENNLPYSLASDDNAGNYYSWTPTNGIHTVIATPYTQSSAGGSAGTPVSITFTVVNSGDANTSLKK